MVNSTLDAMVHEENDQESLSETERHWDQACLTIATAALAAVFFVSGLGKPANDPGNSLTLIKMMATGIATGIYLILILLVIQTIFRPITVPRALINEWKREKAAKVFSMFGTLVVALTLVVFTTIFAEREILFRP